MKRLLVCLLAVLALSSLAEPLAAHAQQAGRVYRLGVLADGSPTDRRVKRLADALMQGLRELANPLAWLLWHMARIEDASLNLLIGEGPQGLIPAGWRGLEYKGAMLGRE